MPTGYTADIKDGISFKTYAMNCARAFGACITLRDEPSGGDKIPEKFEPTDYHEKKIAEAETELAKLEGMTPEQCETMAGVEYREAEASRKARLREIAVQREKYEAMLEQVNAWTPPTPDHEKYHEFMRVQIEESIKFDCNTNYYDRPIQQQTGEEWAASRKEKLARDIAYHQKEHADEVERAERRTAWVSALRGSFK